LAGSGAEPAPIALTVTITFPRPAPLPSVEMMTEDEIIRELAAVVTQREAETAAALAVLEGGSGGVTEGVTGTPVVPRDDATPAHHPAATPAGDAWISGSFRVEHYVQPALAAVMEEEGGGLDDATMNDGAAGFDALVVRGAGVRVDVSAAPAATAGLYFVVRIPDCLDVRSRAFAIPRTAIQAGCVMVGAPAAVDAVTAVKALLAARLGSGGLDTAALAPSLVAGAYTNSGGSANNGCVAIEGLMNAHVRVLPHAHLTASQSEARVVALVTTIRRCVEFPLEPPMAPLLPTRLGCSHVPKAGSHDGRSAAAPAGGSMYATPTKRGGGGGAGAVEAPGSGSVWSPLTLATPSRRRPAVTLNYASGRALARAPTATRGLHFTSPAPCALARAASTLDLTRADRSPASYNPEDHAAAMRQLQVGLQAMTAQRRQEEAHMLRVTRVRPTKNPRGGYCYVDADTGLPVDAKEYEHLYLAEVDYASQYIRAATALAREQEAAVRAAEEAEWSEERRRAEAERAAVAKATRVSWWDQDVDDGLEAHGQVATSSAGGATYYTAATTAAAADGNDVSAATATATVAGALVALARDVASVVATKTAEHWVAVAAAAAVPMESVAAPTPAAPRQPVPFDLLALIVTAGADCIRGAADRLLQVAPVADGSHDAAGRALWEGIAEALAAYCTAHGAEVVVPSQLELHDVQTAAMATVPATVPLAPAAAQQPAVATFDCMLSPAGLWVAGRTNGGGDGAEGASGDGDANTSDLDIGNMSVGSLAAARTPGRLHMPGLTVAAILQDAMAAVADAGGEGGEEGIVLQMLPGGEGDSEGSDDAQEAPTDDALDGGIMGDLDAAIDDDVQAPAEGEGSSGSGAGDVGVSPILSATEPPSAAAAPLPPLALEPGAPSCVEAPMTLPLQLAATLAAAGVHTAVVPAPREDCSPTPADDDTHASGGGGGGRGTPTAGSPAPSAAPAGGAPPSPRLPPAGPPLAAGVSPRNHSPPPPRSPAAVPRQRILSPDGAVNYSAVPVAARAGIFSPGHAAAAAGASAALAARSPARAGAPAAAVRPPMPMAGVRGVGGAPAPAEGADASNEGDGEHDDNEDEGEAEGEEGDRLAGLPMVGARRGGAVAASDAPALLPAHAWPRISFLARARAALSTVFSAPTAGAGAGSAASGGAASAAPITAEAEALLSFFSAGGDSAPDAAAPPAPEVATEVSSAAAPASPAPVAVAAAAGTPAAALSATRSASRTPRPSPRPLPDFVYVLAADAAASPMPSNGGVAP